MPVIDKFMMLQVAVSDMSKAKQSITSQYI